jgi:Domain of unknown function (DUF4395)
LEYHDSLGFVFNSIDQEPKRFAARIGLIFSAAICTTYFLGYPTAVTALITVLIIFSFLESFFAFCAGCHAYTIWKKIVSP